MMRQITPWPTNEPLPSYINMANSLVKMLPESERTEARQLLVEQIFPKNLIGLSEHPKPCDLVEYVYEELAESLSESPKNQRLEALFAASCEAEIYEQSISSLSMAIARYAKQHPDVADEAREWLDPTNQLLLSISILELQCEASKRLEQLNRWQKWAKADHRTIWQAYRLKFIHSRFNLKSVKSGCFSTAMGSLADFLDSVGAEFDKPYLH